MRPLALFLTCSLAGFVFSCGNAEQLAPLWPAALNGLSVANSCGTVSISPSGDIFAGSVTVTMTSSGQYIRYTTDGSTPTANSLVYNGPIVSTSSGTFKALASCGTVFGTVSSKSYTVFPGSILFVSPTGNDVTGTGSQSNPYATPAKALTTANAGTGIYHILVAAGTYNLGATLTVNSGREISMWGGYNATDWTRNISTNVSRIVDTNIGAGAAYLINHAVATTTELAVDGFTFDMGAFSAVPVLTTRNAIEVVGAPLVRISNNIINTDYQYASTAGLGVSGILLNPNAAFSNQNYKIYNNKITMKCTQGVAQGAGNATTVMRGIQTTAHMASTSLVLDIYNNVINMPDISGVGIGTYFPVAIGIDENNGAGLIGNNKVNVRNNTIIIKGEGAGTYAYRGIAVMNKTDVLNVENNIIYATNSQGIGLWVSQPAAAGYNPSVRNNNFFQLEFAYAEGGMVTYSVAGLNAFGFARTAGAPTNLSFDLVDGANTYFTSELTNWTLATGDPSSGAGFLTIKTGGINGATNSFGFTTDLNGTARTGSFGNGWSLGAYEQDQ